MEIGEGIELGIESQPNPLLRKSSSFEKEIFAASVDREVRRQNSQRLKEVKEEELPRSRPGANQVRTCDSSQQGFKGVGLTEENLRGTEEKARNGESGETMITLSSLKLTRVHCFRMALARRAWLES